MNYLLGKIACWLIKKEAISQDEMEVYEYAIYSCILTFLPLLIIMIIGLFMHKVVESMFIILPFMVIRKYSGGYHAKHFGVCMISSCGILFLCVYVINLIEYFNWSNLFMIISVFILIIFSPIDSENRRLNEREKKRYKQMTLYIVIAFSVLYVVLLSFHKVYALCVMEGMVLTAGLQLPCIILKFSEKKSNNN